MKHSIISNLSDIEFKDIGTDSDESVDYPDYANKLSKFRVIVIHLEFLFVVQELGCQCLLIELKTLELHYV